MKRNKRMNLLTVSLFIIALSGCDKMDDNYEKYLEVEKVYSPKVMNLTAEEGLMEATLFWDNPAGNIAKQILIDYGDSLITTEEMVDSVKLSGLEIKGYDVSVFTIDGFGNLSVPATIQIFPNGAN